MKRSRTARVFRPSTIKSRPATTRSSRFVQYIERALVTVRRGLVFQSRLRADKNRKAFIKSSELQYMLDLATFSHADQAQCITSRRRFDKRHDTRVNRQVFANELWM